MRLGLAQRLILSLTAIVLVIGVVAGTVSIGAQERNLLNAMVLGADQLSKAITSATWHLMLADNRQSAYEVMYTIALKQGIDRIRIFNREGRVMFSTHANEVEQRVGKSADVCSVCHATLQPRVHLDATSRVRVHRQDGHRSLTMVTPIYNEPSCSQADCHAHPESMKVLGVLDLTLGLDTVDAEIRSSTFRIVVIFGSQALLINLFIILFARRFVARPVRALIAATKSVSEMNLDQPIQGAAGGDEIGQLARSFDIMRERLRAALAEINSFTQRLETKVAERTAQLKAAQQKLVQTDRLVSLGQLSASVAHEINNPVSGVLNLAMLMQRILRDDGIPPGRVPDFRNYLGQVINETTRVGRIVSDLLAFSRRSKPQRTDADLNRIVQSTLAVTAHKLRLSNVEVDLDLAAGLPPLQCDSSQIQQVILNLLMNAAEASHGRDGARLAIRTSMASGDRLALTVSDNGEGIPPENLQRIFDPFFTTKPEGKGVGLGLAVLYGIVQAHGGDVAVTSQPGEGSTFTVTLPLAPSPAMEANVPVGRV